MADLKDIELARVGEFELSTGPAKFTPEMLADAARRASEAGPAFRAAMKLGHTDPRNDGEPAMGWLHNVRVGDDGVLRGDATGVPQWLADNAKSAYPDRSIEANLITNPDGTKGMELTALSLLGVTPPGITTLQSWRELPTLIAAASALDVTSFAVAYAAIRDTQTPAEPPVIVPIPTPKEADAMSETLVKGLRERFGFADDANEETILKAIDEAQDPAVTPEAIAASLKLDPEKVKAALAAAAGTKTDPVIPAGMKLVSDELLEELKIGASAGAAARAAQLVTERDTVVEEAYRTGKIAAARKPDWAKRWDIDPEGTKADLAELPAVYPVAASGHTGDRVTEGASAWADAELAQLAASAGIPVEALNV